MSIPPTYHRALQLMLGYVTGGVAQSVDDLGKRSSATGITQTTSKTVCEVHAE